MSRYHMCPDCGHRMRKIDDDLYQCDYCAADYDDYDGNEGCAACGNPAYPECQDGCPMFDD